MAEEASGRCNHRLFRHEHNEIGFLVCTGCSVVLDDCLLSEDAVFTVDNNGRIGTDSNRVNSVPGDKSVSHDSRLRNAYDFISTMVNGLSIGDGDHIALPAKAFYSIALDHEFVKGRRCDLVAASCLYIACREQKKPFLLIEFAYYLRVDVYVLGAVFLQLVKLLHLEEHPRILKPVDPSLFVHRFVYGLIGERNKEVEKTALKIVTSMKHNWIQTGRKPSGICGAAVYLSALSHGYSFTKAQVVKTVHVCEATLTKRLIEFEETECGELTVDEFQQKTEELPRKFKKAEICKGRELLCVHKKGGQVPHFAHGLCEECYDEFLTMSGGLDGGSDPPAFKRAERKRLALAGSKESTDNLSGITDGDAPDASDCNNDMSDYAEYMGTVIDESGFLSDVDDDEIENCIHTEEEKKFKEKIWEELNPDYDEIMAAAKDVKKPKKERKRKATAEAQTAAEAAHDMLVKRKISSKIDLEKLKELFGETDVTDENPKSRTESRPNEDENEVTYDSENAGEADEYDEMETVGEYGEEYNTENFHDAFDHYYDDAEGGDLDDW